MDDIIEMEDIIDYCKKCKCRYIRTNEDYNRLGEPLKCCSKCRIRNSKRPKKKSIIKADDTDTKKMNKCINCKQLWERKDKVWESVECLKCYKCRANGGNPDDIDIAHDIYPEKIPVIWKPDSESD